jgi:multisubunit Na+/H+ antiporter MnhG subunit
MGLDIRLPMGIMFAVIGALLVAFGLISDPALYARSLGININLWWGVAMLVFGLAMLTLGWRGRRPSR